jgi:hypothetical protein
MCIRNLTGGFMKRSLILGAAVSTILFSSTVSAKPEFKVNGDVEYRYRINLNSKKDKDGEEIDSESKNEYHHRYAWNLKLNVKVKENISFGFRLNNPNGKNLDSFDNSLLWQKGLNSASLGEAWFKVNVKMFDFSAGRIPQSGTSTLDLLAFEDSKYSEVVSSCWDDLQNAGILGANFTYTAVKDDDKTIAFKLVNAMYSSSYNAENDGLKKSSFLHILEVPIKIGNLSLNPNGYVHRNMNYDIVRTYDTLVDAVHAYGAGLDLGIKPVKPLDIRAGFGVSFYDNTEAHTAIDTIDHSAPFGVLASLEARIKPGYGEGRVKFALNQNYDREDTANSGDPVKNTGSVLDIRYILPIKNMSIAPRFRMWNYVNNNDESLKRRIRPELILSAKF